MHITSRPLTQSVYNPQLEDGKPELTTTEHEDYGGLERLADTYAPSRLMSEEDSALAKSHYKKCIASFGSYMIFICDIYNWL